MKCIYCLLGFSFLEQERSKGTGFIFSKDKQILSTILKEHDVVDWTASLSFAGETIEKYIDKYIFL